MKRMYPLIITPKIDRCAEFYRLVFRFEEVTIPADIRRWYVHLRHPESGAELAFMKPGLKNQHPQMREQYADGLILTLEVEDVDAEWKMARPQLSEQGVIFEPVTEEEISQRHFAVLDPAGVSVDVVQQLRNYD